MAFMFTICLWLCLSLAGCCHTRRYNHTLTQKIKFAIQAQQPEQYYIRVPSNGDYPVPSDGRISLSYTNIYKAWELVCGDGYLLDSQSCTVEAIYIMQGKSIVQKIPLTPPEKFVNKFPVDDKGYYVVRVNQKK
jgi:hypothetical protein